MADSSSYLDMLTGDINCTEAIDEIKKIDDAGKLTNGSAKARAIAMLVKK
ncbi:hypothetical protein [Avibacterium paragallinarum]|uniref:Uncharacterized protein n=1 Tax=Avibacterium paragallinarum TaxID=728 RepID=A0ABU7QRU9_AVIPA|nr:hypothetical protein [Avibacterium paragallinarum]